MYSSTAAPMSALDDGVTVIVGGAAEPAVTGALQTLSSVWSPAVKCVSSVKVSPAESVTLLAVAALALQIPVSTTSRSPVRVLAGSDTDRLEPVPECPDAPWT